MPKPAERPVYVPHYARAAPEPEWLTEAVSETPPADPPRRHSFPEDLEPEPGSAVLAFEDGDVPIGGEAAVIGAEGVLRGAAGGRLGYSQISSKADFQEIGESGLVHFGGYIEADFQREWTNPRKYDTIALMLRHPIIAGMTYAIEQIIRRVRWGVVQAPDNDSASAKNAKTFVEGAMRDMETPWAEVISQSATHLWYGFSVMELLYKRRSGPTGNPLTTSKFTDGQIGWRRWSMRAQETLIRWLFDDNNEVIGVNQFTPNGHNVDIPLGKCVHLATVSRKQSPEGQSLLTACWDSWYKMTFIEKFEAIGIQRDLAGFPVGRIPGEFLSGKATADQKAVAAQYRKILQRIHNDDQGYALLPSDLWTNDLNQMSIIPRFSIELMRSAGPRQFDTNAVITRYSTQITLRLLADFLMTANATSKGGSKAAHTDKTRIFEQAVQSVVDYMGELFTVQAVVPLGKLNGWAIEDMPAIKPEEVEIADLTELSAYLTALSSIGVPFTDELKEHLYDVAEFPTSTLDVQLKADADLKAKMQKITLTNLTNPPAPVAPDGSKDGSATPGGGPVDKQQNTTPDEKAKTPAKTPGNPTSPAPAPSGNA